MHQGVSNYGGNMKEEKEKKEKYRAIEITFKKETL